MSELIDRQAAIIAVSDQEIGMLTQWDIGRNSGLNFAIEKIKALPTIQPEPPWIPCSERLPNTECGESENVICTCRWREAEENSPKHDKFRWIKVLYFNGGNWCYPTGETYEPEVLAWMPLPKPFEGEQK